MIKTSPILQLTNIENVWGKTINLGIPTLRTFYLPGHGDAKNLYGCIDGLSDDITDLRGCCSNFTGQSGIIKLFSNDLNYLYSLFSFLGKNYKIIFEIEYYFISIMVIDTIDENIYFKVVPGKDTLLNTLLNKIYIEKQKHNKRKLLSSKTKNLINNFIDSQEIIYY